MKHTFNKAPGPIKLFCLQKGYTQTRLRKEFSVAGTITPLAEFLHAEFIAEGHTNTKGQVPRVQSFIENLCDIRNQKNRKVGANGKGIRRNRAARAEGVDINPGAADRSAKIPDIPIPVKVTGVDFLQDLPNRVQLALEHVDSGLSIFADLASEFELARRELTDLCAQLNTRSLSVKLTLE